MLLSISDRFLSAISFHRQSTDLFYFLGFGGFAALHKHQHREESDTQMALKRFIIETYNDLPPDTPPKDTGILDLIKDTPRLEIDSKIAQKIIISAFSKYKKWETETLSEYEKISIELLNKIDTKAFAFVQKIIEKVNDELNMLTSLIVQYNAFDWDMSEIAGRQSELVEKYTTTEEK